MIKNIAFIITSVIYPSSKPLSYTSTRSIFTPKERELQTIETIKSIRRKYYNAKIILLEMGLRKDIDQELISLTDKYIFIGNNLIVRHACDSKYKGLGEAIGLIISNKKIPKSEDYYFKISGRYYLTNNHDPKQFASKKWVVKSYGYDISTRLYGFPNSLLNSWRSALIRTLPRLSIGHSIEHVLPKHINANVIQRIPLLGVAGFVAPNGELLEE